MLNIPLYFVHTKVMTDLLNGTVEIERINKHYWELMVKYAGVEPSSDRPESAIDFPYNFYLDMEENHQTKCVLNLLHILEYCMCALTS